MAELPIESESQIRARVKTLEAELDLQIPTEIPIEVAHGLLRAFETAFALFFPKSYIRLASTKGKAKVINAFSELAAKKLVDAELQPEIAAVLQNLIVERLDELQGRKQILKSVVRDLADEVADYSNKTQNKISDDFLFHFWKIAGNTSNEAIREIFSKILASEISDPGRFSASTLNILSTMHPKVARNFERLCNMSFSFSRTDFVIIAMPSSERPSTTYNSVASVNRMGFQLADFGLTGSDMLELRSAGLIRSVPDELEYPGLREFFSQESVEFAGSSATLVVEERASKTEGFSVYDATGFITLSNSGSEIRSVLLLQPYGPYLTRLIEVMGIAGVTMTVHSTP